MKQPECTRPSTLLSKLSGLFHTVWWRFSLARVLSIYCGQRAVLYVLSGFVHVSGAIVIEFLSQDMINDSLPYMQAVAVEAGCEMAGACFFLAVNLHLLQKQTEHSNLESPE